MVRGAGVTVLAGMATFTGVAPAAVMVILPDQTPTCVVAARRMKMVTGPTATPPVNVIAVLKFVAPVLTSKPAGAVTVMFPFIEEALKLNDVAVEAVP